MKKLFISVPMKDRTQEAIEYSMQKMKKIAEAVFEEDLEVIDSYNAGNEDENPLVCLGQSIALMADADYFIGIVQYGLPYYRGCAIEDMVASQYDIDKYLVPEDILFLPDEFVDEVDDVYEDM